MIRAAFLLMSMTLLLASGCARQPIAGNPATAPDPSLGLGSFIEEGDLVAFVVGTKVAALREKRDAMPVEIVVVNKGLANLTLTRESFTLIDDAGNRYAAIGGGELARRYGNTAVDFRLASLPQLVRRKYGSYGLSNGYVTETFDRPTPARTRLPRFAYLIDFVYCPKPEGGWRGRTFELFLDSPDLDDPVFVRFTIDGAGR